MTPEEYDRLISLVHAWRNAAARNAAEAKLADDDERYLHNEAAHVYERCADDLFEALK